MGESIAYKTPLVELLRDTPKDFRASWPVQWAEDGRETGCMMSPVGLLVHEAADELEALQRKVREFVCVMDMIEMYFSREVSGETLLATALEMGAKHKGAE